MHPTVALLGLDLALTVLGTVLWVVAAVLAGSSAPEREGRALTREGTHGETTGVRWRDVGAAGAALAALLALAARGAVLARVGGQGGDGGGWWFVGERVALGLPVAVAGAAVALAGAGPVLVRSVRGPCARDGSARGPEQAGDVPARRRAVAVASLLTAAAGSLGALAATTVVGYPVAPLAAAWLVALVGGAAAVVWVVLVARPPGRVRASVGIAYALALVLAGGWAWADDAAARVGPVALHGGAGAHTASVAEDGEPGTSATTSSVSVTDLRLAPGDGPPGSDVRRYALTARTERVRLPSGTTVDAWAFEETSGASAVAATDDPAQGDGTVPGPALTATQGDVVEVTLRNADVAAGVTLHWHGYDVPNGDDGVAGVTQDAVAPGEERVYRFLADQAGTYWYHTHQSSARGVQRGLFGTLVVRPAGEPLADLDLALPVHTLDGATLLGGSDVPVLRAVAPGATVRLRLVNTDQVPRRFSVEGAPFRVVAVDGDALVGPGELPAASAGRPGTVLRVPAGGRYDVGLTMPDGAVRLAVEGAPGAGLVLGGPGTATPAEVTFLDGTELDLLDYGTPARPDPHRAGDRSDGGAARPDVDVLLVLDRQLRPVHGVPAYAWTVNGRVWPHVPPITVHEGDLVRLVVVNRSTETHPVHPHGHDVEVVARDGVAPRGSPLHLDTFDVRPGEVWEVLLRADNPGLWMSHCHNLDHAALGMVLHLAYAGVSTPYELGGHGTSRPSAPNDPE